MPNPPERTVGDALFGELPPEVRARHGLDTPRPSRDRQDDSGGARAADRSAAADRHDDLLPAPRPDAPETPWQMNRSEWIGVAKSTYREISHDRVMSVSAGVTFYGLLALFPAITALVSIYGLVADPTTMAQHLDLLQRFMPDSALQIIRGQVESIAASPGSALTLAGLLGLLLALWSANGGMKALIDALNVAWFESETRGFIRLNLVALAFTLGALVLIISMIGVIAVIPIVLRWLPLGPATETIITWVRWPVLLAVLMIALAALYRWGPSKDDAHWHWISPGALLASGGLVIASVLFSFYTANFANYNETYGSLGAVVALMMWLWIAAMVVMMGAELNSETERHLRALNGELQKDDSEKA